MTDWNAVAYDELSGGLMEWAYAMLSGVELRGDERVLDAGCGSGLWAMELLRRLPNGKVIALEPSPTMQERVRQRLVGYSSRVEFMQTALDRFVLDKPVDGVFCNGAMHRVWNHEAFFKCCAKALKPGGWLLAQSGAIGGMGRAFARARRLAAEDRFFERIGDFGSPGNVLDEATTRAQLEWAGFEVKSISIDPVPMNFPKRARFEMFLSQVMLFKPLATLPDELQREFLHELSVRTMQEEGSYTLDHVKLTLHATKK